MGEIKPEIAGLPAWNRPVNGTAAPAGGSARQEGSKGLTRESVKKAR
jgi:hypothetical protein